MQSKLNPKIICVIFSWPKKELQARLIELRLKFIGIEVDVIHAGNHKLFPGWHLISVNSYYGEQFAKLKKIIKNREFTTILLIQADAILEKPEYLIERILYSFKSGNVGVWTGQIDYTYWTLERTKLPFPSKLKKYFDASCESVSTTDTTLWAISKDVLSTFLRNKIELPKLGYGIDLVMSAIATLENQLTILDKSVKVLHTKGSGYSEEIAINEMNHYLSKHELVIQKIVSNTLELARCRDYK